MSLYKYGFTLIEILIVVSLIAILTAMAIPNLLRAKVASNDTLAKATLRCVATALESYISSNSQYPDTTDKLLTGNPPYMNVDYFTGTYNGFTFSAELNSFFYSVTATPDHPNHGSASFTISTGGSIIINE